MKLSSQTFSEIISEIRGFECALPVHEWLNGELMKICVSLLTYSEEYMLSKTWLKVLIKQSKIADL